MVIMGAVVSMGLLLSRESQTIRRFVDGSAPGADKAWRSCRNESSFAVYAVAPTASPQALKLD
jgi:hypothetical protein